MKISPPSAERQIDLFLHVLLRENMPNHWRDCAANTVPTRARSPRRATPTVASAHLRRFGSHSVLALPRARQERVRVRIGNQPSRAREHHGRRRQARRVSAGMAGLFSERERFRCRHRQIDSVRGGEDPDISCRPDLEGIGRRDVEPDRDRRLRFDDRRRPAPVRGRSLPVRKLDRAGLRRPATTSSKM